MDDSNEPTVWQDINPPMASARQQGRHSPSLDDDRLVFRNELTACLALTAPVGMTEESRREWLAIAWDTLNDIPPDILAIGARAARKKCDHPCKIVPTIVAECAEMLSWRSMVRRPVEEVRQIAAPEPNYCTPEEAKAILDELGIKRNWAAC